MVATIVDITGQRFSRLVVLKMDRIEKGTTFWLCRCDCGKEKIIRKASLISKQTKSCGCLKSEKFFGKPRWPELKQ